MLQGRIRSLEDLRDRLDSCIGCGCLSLTTCALQNPDDEARAKETGLGICSAIFHPAGQRVVGAGDSAFSETGLDREMRG